MNAAQLPVAPDTPPLDGPELKLLFYLCATASRQLQIASVNALVGAATAAPRRCVACEAGVQVNGRVVRRLEFYCARFSACWTGSAGVNFEALLVAYPGCSPFNATDLAAESLTIDEAGVHRVPRPLSGWVVVSGERG